MAMRFCEHKYSSELANYCSITKQCDCASTLELMILPSIQISFFLLLSLQLGLFLSDVKKI